MFRRFLPTLDNAAGATAELAARSAKAAAGMVRLKSGLAGLTVFAALALGSAGALAQQNPYTKAPPPAPISRQHQEATLNHDPAACANAVELAADDIGLRIQGKEGMDSRTLKTTWLQAARNSAAAGDDEGCWHWFDRVQNLAR